MELNLCLKMSKKSHFTTNVQSVANMYTKIRNSKWGNQERNTFYDSGYVSEFIMTSYSSLNKIILAFSNEIGLQIVFKDLLFHSKKTMFSSL